MATYGCDMDRFVEDVDRRVPAGGAGLADEVDLIRRRAEMLSGRDKALIMLYVDKGRQFREAAALMGVSEATVARRVGRIIRRLMDGQYIACLRQRDRLGRLGMAVAKDHLIDGMSIHAIAVRRGQRVCECEVRLGAGQVCYITGPSGSGKSVLLGELWEKTAAEDRVRLEEIELERGRSLIDCIEGDVCSTLRLLSRAGLGDAFSVLSRPAELSEGQKYRYRLARAIAGGARVIFADEFCSNLDRITAAVIAHHVGRIARGSGRTFVLASSHDDLLCDLEPDVIVVKRLGGGDEVIYRR